MRKLVDSYAMPYPEWHTVNQKKDIYLFDHHQITDDGSVARYAVWRTPDGRYRFYPPRGPSYIVRSWKAEISQLTNGKVNYN